MPWFEAWRKNGEVRETRKRKPCTPAQVAAKRRKAEADLDKLQLQEGSVCVDARGRPSVDGVAALASIGYDPETFTQIHHKWKDANLHELLALCRPAADSVLYLDHWTSTAENRGLRTTDVLLDFAGFAPERCYCANPEEAIVSRLRERRVKGECSMLADALKTAWRDETFEVVYTDFCYGSAEHVTDDLKILLDRASPRSPRVLAWTLTGRAEGAFHNRLAAVHDFLDARRYRPALGSVAASWRTFRPSSVVTGFYCRAGVE